MNILIPMAGLGSRFQQVGYKMPKPLIDIYGKTMIEHVIANINIDGKYIFITQQEHCRKYNVENILNNACSNCKIIKIDGLTEGAACTTLFAKEFINNDSPLLITNSDQYIDHDINSFVQSMIDEDVDGGILTFNATESKWSFVKLDENGFVVEVAEKKPISDIATAGVYFWKKGSDYIKYAESMINKNIRVNNEFYVCPIFNEAIQDGKKIKTLNIYHDKMWSLGTPEDLQKYLSRTI